MELFIPDEIKNISKILNNAGYQCYLVGGAIRNQLLGREAKDYDLTTNAEPDTVMSLFKRVIPTGIKHGTVTILMGDHGFEITTYRIDGKYTDGRRPDKIEFTPSIDEDLQRRDFTINSIAYNIEDETILDINNGIEDLHKNIIRAIGTPARRFDEDALRLVRACRFASQLNFEIEESTYKAMSETLGKLGDVSKERISEELIKILGSNNPSIAFNHFYQCGMLEILFPNIYNKALTNPDLFKKALIDMDNIITDKPSVKFARLLSIIPHECHLNTLKELKLSNNFIKNCIHLTYFLDIDLSIKRDDFQIRTLISQIEKENIPDLKTIWKGMFNRDNKQLLYILEKIDFEVKQNHPFNIKDLKISGSDLISEFKIKAGPEIGKILKLLLHKALIDPNINSRERLLILAKEQLY